MMPVLVQSQERLFLIKNIMYFNFDCFASTYLNKAVKLIGHNGSIDEPYIFALLNNRHLVSCLWLVSLSVDKSPPIYRASKKA